jgi:hypothetical protein
VWEHRCPHRAHPLTGTWTPGFIIYRGASERNLRVVDNLPSDDPEEFAILVVEEVTNGERKSNPRSDRGEPHGCVVRFSDVWARIGLGVGF